MTTDLPALCQRLRALHAAATPGPWVYDSYCRVIAVEYVKRDSEMDDICVAAKCRGLRYRDGKCATCNPDGVAKNACPLWSEIYENSSDVASVPTFSGTTALGRHADDAELIAEMRNALPELLAVVERAALAEAVCQSMYALETHNNAVNDDEKWPDYAKWLHASVSLNRVHRDAYAAWRAARDAGYCENNAGIYASPRVKPRCVAARDGAGDDGDGVR